MIDEADRDGDGEINEEEFLRFVTSCWLTYHGGHGYQPCTSVGCRPGTDKLCMPS